MHSHSRFKFFSYHHLPRVPISYLILYRLHQIYRSDIYTLRRRPAWIGIAYMELPINGGRFPERQFSSLESPDTSPRSSCSGKANAAVSIHVSPRVYLDLNSTKHLYKDVSNHCPY